MLRTSFYPLGAKIEAAALIMKILGVFKFSKNFIFKSKKKFLYQKEFFSFFLLKINRKKFLNKFWGESLWGGKVKISNVRHIRLRGSSALPRMSEKWHPHRRISENHIRHIIIKGPHIVVRGLASPGLATSSVRQFPQQKLEYLILIKNISTKFNEIQQNSTKYNKFKIQFAKILSSKGKWKLNQHFRNPPRPPPRRNLRKSRVNRLDGPLCPSIHSYLCSSIHGKSRLGQPRWHACQIDPFPFHDTRFWLDPLDPRWRRSPLSTPPGEELRRSSMQRCPMFCLSCSGST